MSLNVLNEYSHLDHLALHRIVGTTLAPVPPVGPREDVSMTALSHRHHEVPQGLLKHFCREDGESLWMRFKDTRDVKSVGVKGAFFRNDGNTRTDYRGQGDGTFEQVKSDRDEKILADFDGRASTAVREVIDFARLWRDGCADAPRLSPETVGLCMRIIVAQARRTRESQDRVGLGDDRSELYLDLFYKRAEELGQQLPSKENLLKDPDVIGVVDVLSQNQRATMASGSHPILADKEEAFLAPLGLHIAVIDPTTAEFVVGSHGTTIVKTTGGRNTWLPLAPDVAISFSDRPGDIAIGIYESEFVEYHNRAALAASARVAGRSERTIRELLATLD